MDAPPIQYCRTQDGVNIAYAVAGAGPPVLVSHLPWAHAQALPGGPIAGSVIPTLVRHFRTAWLDGRGTGMSDRVVADNSFDARLADIEAVADALRWDRFALYGSGMGCLPVVRFAAQYPQRVSRLSLVVPFARGADFIAQSSGPAVSDLARIDMQLMVETVARGSGMTDPETIARFADLAMRSIGREEFVAILDEVGRADMSDDLGKLQCPTLVVAFEQMPAMPVALPRGVAARVPDSRLVLLNNWGQDDDQHIRAVADFLGETGSNAASDRPASPIRTLLFTDLESSTALTQSLGDVEAQEILHGHNAAVRAALAAHQGEEVKHLGDGIMAAFGSAVSAVQAALQIQRELAGAEVRVRIGLNAGEPIAEDDDYFGTAVQLAARVCDRAEPGQVLVSNVVRELCAGKTFDFVDQGETTLKGFPEAVRLFAVGQGE